MKGFGKDYRYEEADRRKLFESIHVGAIVRVIEFDPKEMMVEVLPLSQHLKDGEYTTPSRVQRVPAAVTRSGKFLFRPWYEPGDIGVILYLDHDMDKVMESGDECKPNTERSHSDSDAVFIGGIIAGGWTAPDLPEGYGLATEDGEIYMVMTQDNILIQGDVDMEGDLTVTGNVTVNGDITVNGGDVVADGISLKYHTHECPHGGTTGPPQ